MQNDKIHILDDTIASRIAAGEVIINPASVVKELIENSIDANATSITLEINNGGKKYIRVTDNGIGMSENDIKLCHLKHATSKVRTLNDLKSINSLGFRGEALGAISAVSLFEIKSRQKENDSGAQLLINGASEPKFSICGAPDGTTVKVKNLFFNLPARRKFLKSDSIECTNVSVVASKMIIANPKIAFKYISNGKIIYQSAGSGSLSDAIRTVYGRELTDKLTPVIIQNNRMTVEGFITRPSFQYKTKKNQLFIVNGRYFNSKQISEAVQSGYSEHILKSHYPAVFLNIKISPENVDANIHPAKTELLFYDEEFLINSISDGISDVLKNLTPENISDLIVENKRDKSQSISQGNCLKIDLNNADRLYLKNNKRLSASLGTSYADIEYENSEFQNNDNCHVKQTDILRVTESTQEISLKEEDGNNSEQNEKILNFSQDLKGYKIVGQLFNTYLLCEHSDTLYIIDQHAAHERLNYEKFMHRLQTNKYLVQALLTPFIKKFNPEDYQLLEDNQNLLCELGFDFEEFGNYTYRFSGLPVGINCGEHEKIIEDLLFELKKNRREDIILKKEKIIKLACTHSVKAGDKLSEKEINFLISEIKTNKTPLTCPHGRPIVTAINKSDLEKGFKRII